MNVLNIPDKFCKKCACEDGALGPLELLSREESEDPKVVAETLYICLRCGASVSKMDYFSHFHLLAILWGAIYSLNDEALKRSARVMEKMLSNS